MPEETKPAAPEEAPKPTFKYRVIEATYRDQRRMEPGEEWVTMQPIHDSRALLPADEATEDAYLAEFDQVIVKIPVRDPFTGAVSSIKEDIRDGQHVAAIMARPHRAAEAKARKKAKDDAAKAKKAEMIAKKK